jgi:hypothetical protein
VDTPLPGRVVAQPVPKPPVPKPPTPATSGISTPAATPAAATPAAAAAAGAASAVASGPTAPTTPAGTDSEDAGDDDEAAESQNGTDEHAVVSQDTEVHPPPAPPDEDEEEREEGDDGHEEAEAEDPDREPAPEDFHEDYDPDDDDAVEDDFEDTGDEPAVAPSARREQAVPATGDLSPPSRPTIPIGGTSSREPTGILPPYEESRPGGPMRSKGGGGGGIFSSPGRAVAVVGGSLLALFAIGFGVLQLTGDDEPSKQSANTGSSTKEPDETTAAKKKKSPGINPGDVRVAVLNGTTVPGLAAQIGDSIERQGFQLGTVTNFIDQQRAESVVKYAPGAEREAADVGKRLKISQREPIDAESQGLAGDATVVVVAGADKTQ